MALIVCERCSSILCTEKKNVIEKIITTKVVEVSTTYMDSLTAGLGMNYGILV